VLRGSRQAFSTSEGASVVSAQNFITQQRTEANENDRRGFPIEAQLAARCSSVHGLLLNHRIALSRNFSSLSVEADNKPSGGDVLASTFAAIQRPGPSALEQANLPEVTPGHAMYVLQKYAAKGTPNSIRQSDFVALCESARPGKQGDAKVIAVALEEFKKNNNFVLQMSGASAAVDGMLRAMAPTWKVQDGKPRLRAAIFAAQQIADEKTGLYFAVETEVVDKVLEEMHQALLEVGESGTKLRMQKIDEDAEEAEEPSANEKMLRDALRVTDEVTKFLIKRKCRPEMEMNKRKRRVYLKVLQIGSGPRRSTLELATKISMIIGGSDAARENIVSPHVTPYHASSWYTKRVEKVVLQMIEEAPEEEPVEAAAATEVAQDDVVDDGEGDDVADEGESGAGDSGTDTKSEEEKKD